MSLLPVDGGKHLIFKIQATSFSSDNSNRLFRKHNFPPLKGFPCLLLHKEASWLVAWKIHVSSWHWDIYSLGLCQICYWVPEVDESICDQACHFWWSSHPPQACLCVLMTWQMTSCSGWSKRPRQKLQSLYKLAVEAICPHVCCILLVTQSNLDALWEGPI